MRSWFGHFFAELDAHYARLLAEGRGNAAASTSSANVKDEPGSSRAPSLGPSAGQDDAEDEMEAVDTNVNRTEDIEAYKNSIIKGEFRAGQKYESASLTSRRRSGHSGRPGHALRRRDRRRSRENVFGRISSKSDLTRDRRRNLADNILSFHQNYYRIAEELAQLEDPSEGM